jgi:hypothetical protein
MAKRRKNRKITLGEVMARKAIAFAVAQDPSYLVEIEWTGGTRIMFSDGSSVQFRSSRAKIPLRLLQEAQTHGCKRI